MKTEKEIRENLNLLNTNPAILVNTAIYNTNEYRIGFIQALKWVLGEDK
ncbi:MAG: hypothetical protein ACE5KE_00215 [Methanosarcinales archaeon]